MVDPFYIVTSVDVFPIELALFKDVFSFMFALDGDFAKAVPPLISVLVIAFACFLIRKIVTALRG